MNKFILFALCFSAYIGISEACGFGALCGGGGGAPSVPLPPPPCGGGGGGFGGGGPTIIQCPGAPLQNSCSGGGGRCLTRRRIFHRRHTRDAVHVITELVNSTDHHPVCNNGDLHKLIEDNLSENAEKTKDAIHRAVVKKMPHGINFAVICSAHPFYFTSDNHIYCLHGNKIMTCYVFQSN